MTWTEILGGTADPVPLNTGDTETPDGDHAKGEDDAKEGAPELQPQGGQCRERRYPERVFMPPKHYMPADFRLKKKRGGNDVSALVILYCNRI